MCYKAKQAAKVEMIFKAKFHLKSRFDAKLWNTLLPLLSDFNYFHFNMLTVSVLSISVYASNLNLLVV